jgi:hypothetical protein
MLLDGHKHDYLFITSRDCIGATDGTHVLARLPKAPSSTFRGRKHYTSHNVLVVVDFDMSSHMCLLVGVSL